MGQRGKCAAVEDRGILKRHVIIGFILGLECIVLYLFFEVVFDEKNKIHFQVMSE